MNELFIKSKNIKFASSRAKWANYLALTIDGIYAFKHIEDYEKFLKKQQNRR